MLLEFVCKNHKSIRDEVRFSAVAGSDTDHGGHCLTVGGLRVLRTSVLYGPNGSGKSNLLDAAASLRAWILGDSVVQMPHKLDAALPSSYAIQFLVDDTRYVYGLSILGSTVTEEYLYAFPHGRRTLLFERDGMKLSATRTAASLADILRADRPLLAESATERFPHMAAARLFFLETLVPYRLDEHHTEEEQLNEAIEILRADAETSKAVCAILSMFGTGIRSIRVENGEAFCLYCGFETNLRQEESTGIRRLVSFLCPLVDMLRRGRVLLCDEPEAHLHEAIVHALLDSLHRVAPDSRAQLIFATHSTSLLNLELFRRDQIWFTELRPQDRSTDLYSLAEFRGIRDDENIRQGYMTGKYGAIPMLDHDFARLFGRGEVTVDG